MESGGNEEAPRQPILGFFSMKGGNQVGFWYTTVHNCSIHGEDCCLAFWLKGCFCWCILDLWVSIVTMSIGGFFGRNSRFLGNFGGFFGTFWAFFGFCPGGFLVENGLFQYKVESFLVGTAKSSDGNMYCTKTHKPKLHMAMYVSLFFIIMRIQR